MCFTVKVSCNALMFESNCMLESIVKGGSHSLVTPSVESLCFVIAMLTTV